MVTIRQTKPAVPPRPAPAGQPFFLRASRGLQRISLAVAGVALFVLGIQLMKDVARLVGPSVMGFLGPLTTEPWHAVAFGWLAAYAILSGSPVAAFSLGLFHVGLIDEQTTFFMIMGSRLGAAFVVLIIGAISLARGEPREKALAMGVLSFLVTYSVYLPAILLGWLLIALGASRWFVVSTPASVLDLIEIVFGPVVSRIVDWLPQGASFVLTLLAVYLGLALFDRAFRRRDPGEPRSLRLRKLLRRPLVSFAIGAGVTLASSSVSLSLGLLVPLYVRGYIDRREIVPFIMGANVTTFVDTLFAAVVFGGGVAANIVLIEMGSVFLFSVLALVWYRRYSRGIDAAFSLIFHGNWALGAFIVLLVAVPALLLFAV